MSRSYLFRFVCTGSGDVVGVFGHGNVRRTAERSARRRLIQQGRVSSHYHVRSCEPHSATSDQPQRGAKT